MKTSIFVVIQLLFVYNAIAEHPQSLEESNIEFNLWQSWTKCSRECGGGVQNRQRTIRHSDCHLHKNCKVQESSLLFQQRECNNICYNEGTVKYIGHIAYCSCRSKWTGPCCKEGKTTTDLVVKHHGGRIKRLTAGEFFQYLGEFLLSVATLFIYTPSYYFPRDKTKPEIHCPKVPPKMADSGQINTVVSWNEPEAHDDRDGNIRPERGGPKPGWSFSSGTSVTTYSAKDKAGNSNSCKVIVNVIVVRCPSISTVSDGYYQCSPSSYMMQGTVCNFGCYRGHKLTGPSSIKCIGNIGDTVGQWSSKQPICERLRCPVLRPAIAPLYVSCTEKNYYRSICDFTCDQGYDIPDGHTRVMLCTETGQWRGSVPTCRDSEPPLFINCIGYQVGFTEKGLDSGFITDFEIPLVKDNVDQNIQPKLQTKTDPYSRLNAGAYDIIYTAEDAAGNKAIDCKIKLVIKMITCPKIYPTANTLVTCTSGSRYGSICDFSCERLAILNGTKTVACERFNEDPYGYWTWGDQQPFCKNAKKCREQLHIPQNGALACDFWLGGRFCQMFCNSQYDIPVGSSVGDNMFVCGESGKWTPSSSIPDCSKVHGSNKMHYRLGIEYQFSGNCYDEGVILKIQQKFLENWKTSAYSEGCLHDIDNCIPANVQVQCGSTSGKRSVSLTIVFDIEMEVNSSVDNTMLRNMNFQQFSAIQNMKTFINSGNVSMSLDGNDTLMAIGLTYSTLQLDCLEGTVPTKNHDSCVKCFSGTFYDRESKSCKICPKGSFQDLEGQSTCIKCPKGTTTKTERSSNETDCELACLPGSWSPDGTSPCTYCPKGTYQESYGQIECDICPGSLTTEFDGVTNVTNCVEFDLQIQSVNATVKRNISIPSGQVITISTWIKVTSSDEDNSLVHITLNEKISVVISLQHNVLCLDHNGVRTNSTLYFLMGKWYHMDIVLSTSGLKLVLDGESFKKTVSLLKFPVSADIQIGNGFVGRISQFNVFTGNADNETSMKCFSNISGDLLNWKSFEETLNFDVFVHLPSECDDTNECDSNPCQNGNCTNDLGFYTCQCDKGFFGRQCQHDVDDCRDNACDNNGTCIDGPASYSCECPNGFSGTLCEIRIVNGSWSEWGNWSSCSVSCGNGTMSRSRLCNSPTPDNGGEDCFGNNTDFDDCLDEECPICETLIEPENTTLMCENDTVTDTINCTLHCIPGYDFDHDPKPFYYCGPETLHQWDFQTEINPLGRLPTCTEQKNASSLKVEYSAGYINLTCGRSAEASIVEYGITNVLQKASNEVACVKDGTCAVSKIKILNCSTVTSEKTDVPIESAGFVTEYECNPNIHGSDECYRVLIIAVETMANQTALNLLNSEIENKIYTINPQSLAADSQVTCEKGMIVNGYNCVPCSIGKYEINGMCVLCGVGFYQNTIGETHCIKCPSGRTTLGNGSVGMDDCTVPQHIIIEGPLNELLICVIASSTFIPILVLILIVRGYMHKFRAGYSFGTEDEMPMTVGHYTDMQ